MHSSLRPQIFFTILLFILNAVPGYSQSSLSYRFSMDTKDTVLNVELSFTGSKTGKTELLLPDEWAGQTQLYKAVQSIAVTGKKAAIQTGEQDNHRYITHAPGAKVTVHYSLKQDHNRPLSYPDNFRAVIQPDYFQFTGYSLLAYPQMDKGTIVKISLDWSGLPENWSIGNSLHTSQRKYTGKIQLGDLENAVFTAGDFRTYVTKVKGKPIYVAIRGKDWKFNDSAFVGRVAAIISTERIFWNDFSQPYYFVSLIPFAQQGSYNGTSLHQSFMLAMAPDTELGMRVDILLAHEYFHRWNGTLITLKEEIRQENSWFSEGFTDYYCHKLLYESGILPFGEYIGLVNAFIAEYYMSPVRNEDKGTHGKNYWMSSEYQKIPYKKGFVYALYIDNLIRSNTHGKYSLDNVMFDMYDMSRKEQTITDSTFVDLVNRYSGQDISYIQEEWINKGGTIPLTAGCIPNTLLSTKELGAFELGFDLNATLTDYIIKGAKEGSEAWKAGVRNGQEIKGASIQSGDITHPVELVVVDPDGTPKSITYKPMALERVAVPQFDLKD